MAFTSSPPGLIAAVDWTGPAGSNCPDMALPAESVAESNSYVVRLARRLAAGVAVEATPNPSPPLYYTSRPSITRLLHTPSV